MSKPEPTHVVVHSHENGNDTIDEAAAQLEAADLDDGQYWTAEEVSNDQEWGASSAGQAVAYWHNRWLDADRSSTILRRQNADLDRRLAPVQRSERELLHKCAHYETQLELLRTWIENPNLDFTEAKALEILNAADL